MERDQERKGAGKEEQKERMKRSTSSRQEVQIQLESYLQQVAEVLFQTADRSWVPFLEEQWAPGKPLFDSVRRLMVCSSFPLTGQPNSPKVGCNDPRLLDVLAGTSNRRPTRKEKEEKEEDEEEEEEEEEGEEEEEEEEE